MGADARPTFQTAAVVVGAILAILVVGSAFNGFALFPPAPGSVTLDGVAVNITYVPSSPQIFGPQNQESCAHCPIVLQGGEDEPLTVVDFVTPANTSAVITLWVNSTIPFQITAGCFAPGPCGATQTFEGVDFTLCGANGWGMNANLFVPNPAPNLPAGFWVRVTVSVQTGPAC
jgi:hypothetical protein